MSKSEQHSSKAANSVLDVNADYSAWSREVEAGGSKIGEVTALGGHFKEVRVF